MIIDTSKTWGWIKTHSKICWPVATGFLSWYAAVRWQVAYDKSEFPMEVYYFFVCAVSGITTVVLTVIHFMRMGFFE